MKEKDIEDILRRGVRKLGGIAYKFTSPGNAGVPDRIVVMPGSKLFFVELKTETGKLSQIQKRQIDRLEERGIKTIVLYGEGQVLEFLDYLAGGNGES